MKKLGQRLRTTFSNRSVVLRVVIGLIVVLGASSAAVIASHDGGSAHPMRFGGSAAAHRQQAAPKTVSYTQFNADMRAHRVKAATMHSLADSVTVKLASGTRYITYFPPALEQQLTNRMIAADVDLTVASPAAANNMGAGSTLMLALSGVFLIVLLIAWLNRKTISGSSRRGRQSKGMTTVREAAVEVPRVNFQDVAGCDEAVEEVREMVDFLSNPEHYRSVGAKMPSGMVLYGPPGTGKTLLAKAVAGESGVPFFAVSGSEFVEMYVGVGASRVRDLFDKARAQAPCVVFIDEIDAVGRRRGGAGPAGGHQEQETTLNEILVQLDGFNGRENVVVIAATNRLDTLDEALLRPGRLTRQVHVGLPNEAGRLEILRVHATDRPIGGDVDLGALAASTAGSSGAQLAEMLNEGAIMAARERSLMINHPHLWEGFLRVVAGPRKAQATLATGERETIAYHESGHVLCAELCPTCDPTIHATINPRGRAAGFAVIGQSDRALHNEQFIHEQLIYILGGRAAEYVINGTVSSGAANDLEKANAIARQAVEQFGLSPQVGQMISGERGLSQEMSAVADREVRRLVDEAYVDAVGLIEEHRGQLELLASALISSGDIDREQILTAMGGAIPVARQPKQPLRLPDIIPAPKPAVTGSGPGRRRMRARVRETLPGAIAASVVASVSDTISTRRARRRDQEGLAGT